MTTATLLRDADPARSLIVLGAMLASCVLPASAQPASPQLATPAALACAPRLPPDESTVTGMIIGAPDVTLRQLFNRGDAVLLNVGRAEGVSVGTQFFTRRVRPADTDSPARGPRVQLTSGWLRSVEVDEHSTLAVIEQICSEIRSGDQLAPFQWPAPVSTAPPGTIGYDDPAMVLAGPAGESMFGAGQFLVIDQGADHQIVPGQRLTMFRLAPRNPEDPVTELGQGFAVLVDSTSATVQLITTREPIRTGDRVAVHR